MIQPFAPVDLQRFVDAQSSVIDDVRAELRAGRKRTHWTWFVFPQVAGLGSSAMAVRYAIATRAEADAYLRHPLLGKRLVECVGLVLAIRGRSLKDILGTPDDLKFCSSMTLFARVARDPTAFQAALKACCGDRPDPRTIERWRAMG